VTKSVFISSTSRDLGEYREAVDRAIRRLELRPINMDDFGSQPGGASGVSLREVAKADMFVGIIARRYGYVPHEGAASITEQEYDEAVRRQVPRLMYLLDPAYAWPEERIEQGEVAQSKLAAFRIRVESQDVRSFFTSPEDLAAKVTADLVKLVDEQHRQDRRLRGIITTVVVGLLLVGVIVVANPGLRGIVGGLLRPVAAAPTITETALGGGVLMTANPSTPALSASAFIEAGTAAYQQGQLDDAVTAFSSAIDLDPQNSAAYNGRGLAYADLDRLDEALTDYNRAIELDPAYPHPYGNRGHLFMERGERQAAAVDFERMISLNSQGNTSEQFTATIGEPLTLDMVPSHSYRITFEANAGQMLTLSATTDQEDVDPIMALMNADGEVLDGDDDGAGGLNALIADFSVPVDGTYTLLVSHTLDGDAGAVEVSIQEE
jgi:tetratricopeptide (TPR) repeat protein